MDGSQLILWTEADTGSRTYFGPRWTERDLSNLPPPAPVGELTWRNPAPDASPVVPHQTGTIWVHNGRYPDPVVGWRHEWIAPRRPRLT